MKSQITSGARLTSIWLLVAMILGPFLEQGITQDSKGTLMLEKAVQLALENNNLVKAATAEVNAANARIRFAASRYFPRISFDQNSTTSNNPVYVFGSLLTQGRFTAENFALDKLNNPSSLNNFQNKFSFSQLVFDFGRVRKGVQLSRLGKDVAENDLEKTRSDLVFRVVKAYYQALLAEEMAQVAEESVKSAKADLEKAQTSFKAGLVVESDLLSVKVHLASQNEELVSARNQARLAYSSLNFEIGMPLDQNYALVKPLGPISSEALDLAELQKLALESRPDIKQSRIASQSSQLAVESAKREFWPVISAIGSWETDSNKYWEAPGNNWLLGVNVHFSIFNGRAGQARLAESRFQERRQSAMQDYLAQAIRLQVQQAYLDLQTASQRIAVNQQAAAQAEESLRIIRNRYQAGLATITDVLRAETATSGAKTSYLRAVFDQRINRANLELQVGRLDAGSRILLE
jgi:outer membrane protein TolC